MQVAACCWTAGIMIQSIMLPACRRGWGPVLKKTLSSEFILRIQVLFFILRYLNLNSEYNIRTIWPACLMLRDTVNLKCLFSPLPALIVIISVIIIITSPWNLTSSCRKTTGFESCCRDRVEWCLKDEVRVTLKGSWLRYTRTGVYAEPFLEERCFSN